MVGEKLGQSDEAPSESLCREECRQGMDGIGGMDECLEQGRTDIAQHVSEEVRHDNACCGELNVQSALQADQQGHCHCKYRQEQFVLDASESTGQSHCRVQQGKDVDNPRSLYVMIESHRQSNIVRS